MFAVNGILFNHESPRRGETFVTRKVTRAVARDPGRPRRLRLHGQPRRRSATGATPRSTSRACGGCCRPTSPTTTCSPPAATSRSATSSTTAFEHAGLDWEKHVRFDERYLRPTEVDALVGDAGKAERDAGLEGRRSTPSSWPGSWSTPTSRRSSTRAGPGSTSPTLTGWPSSSCTHEPSDFAPGAARPGRDDLRRGAPRHGRLGDLAHAGGRRASPTCVGRDVVASSTSRPRRRLRLLRRDRPRYVVLAAAKVGGILANNTYPVDFLSDNLRIQTNVMDAALEQRRRAAAVPRARRASTPGWRRSRSARTPCSPGTSSRPTTPTRSPRSPASCGVQAVRRAVRPALDLRDADQPLRPGRQLLARPASHVLPALIRRYDEAVRAGRDRVTNWGTGTPRREFLHVDDMADACLHLLEHYDGPQQVNVGTGQDATIREIAELVAEVVGYEGETAVGHRQARRHAAEAARRQQAGRRGLDRADRPARRARVDGRVVPRARRRPARVRLRARSGGASAFTTTAAPLAADA